MCAYTKDQDYLANLWLKKTDFWHTNKDKVLLKLIKGNNILDMGCGAGTLSVAMAKLGKNVTAIDNSSNYLNLARQNSKGLKIKYILADCTKYKFKQKFDAIILCGILEHLEDDFFMLKRVYDLLNKRGQLVLLTSAYSLLYSKFDKSVKHYRRYDEKQLVKLLKSCGFQIIKLKYWDILGLLPLFIAKITGKIISPKTLDNQNIDKILNWWFEIFENKMPFHLGADIIVVVEK